MRTPGTALAALAVILQAAPARSQEVGGPGAIQERRFRPRHELSVGVGWLPLDPLTKGVTGSLGYTLHMSDHLAWRVAEAGVSSGIRTSIRKDLQVNYGRSDRDFAEPIALLTSELIWQALYGRESFLNRGAVWSGTTLHVGGGAVLTRDGDSTAPRPAALVGLGMKVYVDAEWAARLEARYMAVVEELALELPSDALWLTLSATWAAGVR